jgi:hypothetical protein
LGNWLLIALGGSAITALVALVGSNTTVKVARLQTEQARRETWETKRLEACEAFLSAATGVFNCLTSDNVEGAREARAAAVAGLARVSFLMGPQSPATSSPETLMKALTEVIKHPEDKNWAKRFEGADPFDGFYAAVYDAMQPPASEQGSPKRFRLF